MRHFTKEQLQAAYKADLYNYLYRYHINKFKVYDVDMRLIVGGEISDISIRRGFYGYKDFKNDETGNGIDFLTKYLNYSLVDAVIALSSDNPTASYNDDSVINNGSAIYTPPSFPQAKEGFPQNLFAYLTKKRGVPEDIVKKLIEMELVYQEADHNNMCFINPEKDWGERRGMTTYAEEKCKHYEKCKAFTYDPNDQWKRCTAYNKDSGTCPSTTHKFKKASLHRTVKKSKHGSFWYFKPNQEPTDVIYICEGSIDAISLYSIHYISGIHENAVYVGIGGAGNQHTIDRICRHHHNVVLAVDNDPKGQECRDRNPELKFIIPQHKDWNEDLLSLRASK